MASFKEVDIEGVQVKIPQDGFASEETLKALVDAMGGRKGEGGAAGGTKGLAGATAKAGKDVKAFGKTLFKMNPGLMALETGFNLLGSAITGATGLVKSLATADGSFTSLNAVVDFSTESLTRFTSMIPIIGGFITATAEATAEVLKLRLAFMQIQQEAFQDLAAAGLRLGGDQGLGGTLAKVLEANISIDQFGNIVSENTDGLRIFGGTINNATKRFADDLERLTSTDSGVGIGLRLLGMNSTAIAEEFSDFVTANRLNRALMTGTEAALNAEMLKRAKNERIITELTGKNIKEQRAAQMAAVADSAFQAALVGMGKQGAELTTFVAGLPGPIGEAVKQIIAFGTVTNEESARLIATIPGLRETLESNIEGIRSGEVSSSKAVADTIQLGQRAIEDGNGLFLAKISMIDPAFAAVADFIMQGRASSIQLENVNKELGKFGLNFASLGEFQEHVNGQYEGQMKTAMKLRNDEGKLTEEMLREQGITDDKTIGILMNALKIEEATGNFQSELFETANNLEAIDFVIDKLIGVLDKAAEKFKMGFFGGEPMTVDKASFVAQNVAIIEQAREDSGMSGAMSASSAMAYNSGFMTGDFTPALESELGSLVPPGMSQTELMESGGKQLMDMGKEMTAQNVAPKEDVVGELKETNRLISEMIRKQNQQITATEDLSGSYTG